MFPEWNDRTAISITWMQLTTVQDGRPVSLMPTFRFDQIPASLPASLAYDLDDYDPTATNDNLAFRIYQPDPAAKSIVLRRVQVAFAPATTTLFNIAFPCFRSHDGHELDLYMHLEAFRQEAGATLPARPQWDQGRILLRTRIDTEATPAAAKPGATTVWPVRLDALDLRFVYPREADKKAAAGTPDEHVLGALEVTVSYQGAKARPQENSLRPSPLDRVPRVDLKSWLPMLEMLPGGQDPLPGEEFVPFATGGNPSALVRLPDPLGGNPQWVEAGFLRARPLVVPIAPPHRTTTPSNNTPTVPLWLKAEEQTENTKSQTLRLFVRRRRGTGGGEPFELSFSMSRAGVSGRRRRT